MGSADLPVFNMYGFLQPSGEKLPKFDVQPGPSFTLYGRPAVFLKTKSRIFFRPCFTIFSHSKIWGKMSVRQNMIDV